VKRLPNANKPWPVQARLPEAPRRFSIDFCGQFAFQLKHVLFDTLHHFGATCSKPALTRHPPIDRDLFNY
jgi:hypothetical protein